MGLPELRDALQASAETGGFTPPMKQALVYLFTEGMGALLQPGSGITVTYDEEAGTFTLAAVRAATINAQTGTSYTAVLGDAFNVVTMDNASANTFTVPPNASVAFETGSVLEVWQKGAGNTTLVAGSGVTLLYHADLTLALLGQHAGVSLRKVGTNTWRVIGQLTPA